MKKLVIAIAVLCLAGGAAFAFWPKGNRVSTATLPVNVSPTVAISQEELNSAVSVCREGPVPLKNYGGPGRRLKNCFVEYPGEPTRQDKSYYIIEDICGQFTSKFMENLWAKKVVRMVPPQIEGLYNCSYYVDDENYVMLVLEYLPIENQKKDQEMLGRRAEKNAAIAMNNLVVWQENGQINSVYLILGENKFISIQRSAKAFANSQELLDFVARLAKEINTYK
jgi:hypothetical protein